MIAQNNRDKAIRSLLETMKDIYDLMSKAEQLKNLEAHRHTVKLIFQQTAECAWFIRDYASRGYVKRG